MKKVLLLVGTVALTGCIAKNHRPVAVGMKNPTAVYCAEQGGKSERFNTAKGEMHYCLLPDGERIEQWQLYRRDHEASRHSLSF